jgi:RNA polymerase primary sigma factor
MKTKTRRRGPTMSNIHVYLCEINETPLLSVGEEQALAALVAEGDPAARDHMVRANLRLVVNIARRYFGRGLSHEDLVSEGNLGLMRAVEGFDATLGIRFSTYAAYWIKQSMRRALICQGKPFRLPAYMVSLLAKWRRACAALAKELGRDPTPDEVGRVLQLTKKKLGMVDQANRISNMTLHTEDSDENSLGRRLVDDHSEAAADRLIAVDEFNRLVRRIDELDEPEATVIRMRFGLGGYSPMTLREAAENLRLSHECVRKMEKHAIRRLTTLAGTSM